jgi:hypothetical protein
MSDRTTAQGAAELSFLPMQQGDLDDVLILMFIHGLRETFQILSQQDIGLIAFDHKQTKW